MIKNNAFTKEHFVDSWTSYYAVSLSKTAHILAIPTI